MIRWTLLLSCVRACVCVCVLWVFFLFFWGVFSYFMTVFKYNGELALILSLPQAIIIGFCKQHRSRWDGSYEPSHLNLRCLTFNLSTLCINFFSSDSLLKKKSRRQTSSEIPAKELSMWFYWNNAPDAPDARYSIQLLTPGRLLYILNAEHAG